MKLAVLAEGTSSEAAVARLAELPEFRRATLNMRLACAAIDALGPSSDLGAAAVVLSTTHGELDPTLQFLATLGGTGVARPFLFQNSLHNATLGFVTQRYGLTGPGFTVTSGATELVENLLMTGFAERCLVIAVDSPAAGWEARLGTPAVATARLLARPA